MQIYKAEIARWESSNEGSPINDFVNREIKFGSELETHLVKGDELHYKSNNIINRLIAHLLHVFYILTELLLIGYIRMKIFLALEIALKTKS